MADGGVMDVVTVVMLSRATLPRYYDGLMLGATMMIPLMTVTVMVCGLVCWLVP